jgi:NAD(P)-dependent dehydrogenase (short-subunit alcohol dehydrogenase family)
MPRWRAMPSPTWLPGRGGGLAWRRRRREVLPRVGQEVQRADPAAGLPRRRTAGVIVNVSTVHEVIPKPRFLGYSVSQGRRQNLTRSLALECARGTRANGIGPRATVTPINRSWIDDPVKRRMVEHIPMQRAGGSEETAAAVAFLCSDQAGR